MIRPWIGITLLGISWLLGLDYYETASPWAQAAVLILGAWMLSTGERANPLRATRGLSRIDPGHLRPADSGRVVEPLALSPVAAGNHRRAPAGTPAERAADHDHVTWCPTWCPTWRPLRQAAAVCITGGVILLVQAVALTFYAAATARSHDLPAVLVKLLATLGSLAGIDAAAMDQCSSCSRCGSRTGWPSPGTWSSIRPR